MIIPLTKGLNAIIDDEDSEQAQYKWYAHQSRDKIYAARRERNTNRTFVFLHRAIVKAPQGFEVDHRNGDSLDNRRSNLRIVSRSDNMANQKRHRDNKSGYVGVTYRKDSKKKWLAKYCSNVIGYYTTAKEAGEAYQKVKAVRFAKK